MKAIQISEPPHFELVNLPDPRWGRSQVLIRTAFCGLCGTGTLSSPVSDQISQFQLSVRQQFQRVHPGPGCVTKNTLNAHSDSSNSNMLWIWSPRARSAWER